MNKTLFLTLMLSSVAVLSADKPVSSLLVVNARMDAYNKHDIVAFLDTYSEDIQIFTYPNIVLGTKGKAHIKKIFGPMFKEGKVQVKIHHQIVQGKYVINHETVTYNGKGKKYVSIYEVVKSVIKSVQFVRE